MDRRDRVRPRLRRSRRRHGRLQRGPRVLRLPDADLTAPEPRSGRARVAAAVYAGSVALVITGIVGGLGLAFREPWLFPSLGPTIFVHTVTPREDGARPWNTFVGHAVGAVAAFASLAVFGALHAPSAMIGSQVAASRIAASALAVALTIGCQMPLKAGHAPAAATTLLITLGGLPADLGTVGVLVAGIGVATLLCDWGRRVVSRDVEVLRATVVRVFRAACNRRAKRDGA